MQQRLKLAAIIAVALASWAIVTEALRMLNQPSDGQVALGIAVLLGVLVIVPGVIGWIWRKREDHVR